MKHVFGWMLVLLGTQTVFSQNLETLVNELNTVYAAYDNLPHHMWEMVAISEHRYTYEELAGNDTGAVLNEYFNPARDSVDPLVLIDQYHIEIGSLLSKIIQTKGFYDDPAIAALKLYHTYSIDRKLWYFYYPAKNGGSWREFYSTGAYIVDGEVKTDAALEYTGDEISSIHTLTSDSGTFYLVMSFSRQCNTCFANTAELVKADNHGLNKVQTFDMQSRDWSATFEYDAATQSLAMEYNADDLNGGCDCYRAGEDYSEEYAEDRYDEVGSATTVQHCKEVYQWRDDYFKQVFFSAEEITKE